MKRQIVEKNKYNQAVMKSIINTEIINQLLTQGTLKDAV